MAPQNAQRALVRMIADAAAARGIGAEVMGEGWIIRLTRGGTIRAVHGYSFDLNTAATHAIACDKSATAEVLARAGVASVHHELFLHPEMARYVPHAGNWPRLLRSFEALGADAVVKDNAGTGGRGVYRVRSAIQLEDAVLQLFQRGHSIALNPFVPIDDEVRFVMLRGVCEAAYSKVRPSVVGDGSRTVLELLAAQVRQDGLSASMTRLLESIDTEIAAVLAEVPGPGVTRLLNWRHNLGQGATVRLHDPADPALANARSLAERASGALNLAFGSVDVVTSAGVASVLEVNSGVMMEALSTVPGGREIAARVYSRAVDLMFQAG